MTDRDNKEIVQYIQPGVSVPNIERVPTITSYQIQAADGEVRFQIEGVLNGHPYTFQPDEMRGLLDVLSNKNTPPKLVQETYKEKLIGFLENTLGKF